MTLSIKQPWADLIVTGIKNIENRTWKTKHRGKIYVHASGKSAGRFGQLLTQDQKDYFHDHPESCRFAMQIALNRPFTTSAIIGEVDIVDCVINHPSIWAEQTDEPTNFISLPFGEEDEKPKYIWNWVLANPVLYDKPILNVNGALSLWEYERPFEVVGSAEMVSCLCNR